MPSETTMDATASVGDEPTGDAGPVSTHQATSGDATGGEVAGQGPAGVALEALSSRVEAFQAAVAAAEEEIRGEVMRRAGAESFKSEQALVELGPFAVGRIDPARFAQLLGVADAPLSPGAVDVLQRADAILAGFATDRDAHVVRVEPGGDLRDAVKSALSHFGRAYGAARAVELARAGTFDPDEHGYLLGSLSFRLWNRAERMLAPPLVVEVRGEDCLPAGLGEFLDGNLVLVLVARGPTTPAPLSRLITPGTFVMQTADPAELERLSRTEHPAVVLLFDEDRPEQAHFVHDPDAGDTPWARLDVSRMPSDSDVGRGRRAPSWLEELAHLRTLAASPAMGAAAGIGTGTDAGAQGTGTSGAGPAHAEDPADRLAAWLLANTDLEGA